MNQNKLVAYYGYLKNEFEIQKVASGGAATSLALAILEKKGVIFGVRYSEDFKSARYELIEKVEELSLIQGTKYIPAQKIVIKKDRCVPVFEEVIRFLKKGQYVLFTGLGCEVFALKNYIKKMQIDDSKLYTVDLICQGPTLEKVHSSFIEELEKKYESSVKLFSVRYKKRGWIPPYIHVEFANGREYEEIFYNSDYAIGFDLLCRTMCLECKFKGENHVADITIGDYWGIKKGMPEFNRNGVSVYLVHSDKGKEMIDMIDKSMTYIDYTDVSKVIKNNPMFCYSRRLDDRAYRFHCDLYNQGLHVAVKKALGVRGELKRVIKKIVVM